ncbi:MAG: LssY C-terminal domain-containing protein [Acidobacteriia bacterium]|nr:LssY C-terminal domain-containing protein [Terriglobia bacterium]
MKHLAAIGWLTLMFGGLAWAQSPTGATAVASQDLNFAVSTAQPWTDTGLELQSGDYLEIAAAGPAPAAIPDRHTVSPPATICDPLGVSTATKDPKLPVPDALPGSLVARLQPSAPAFLVGGGKALKIDAPGHLFLGVNADGTPPCAGTFSVKVHLIGSRAASSPTSPAKSAMAADQTQPAAGQTQPAPAEPNVKQKLAAAAQTWLAGQFGSGATSAPATANPSSAVVAGNGVNAPTTTATATPAKLTVSTTPLDAGLSKEIDGLPRRVNDQFNNLGDMVNFVLVGSQQQVQTALEAANWHVADTNNTQAAVKAVFETINKKDYLAMPMSPLQLFGRVQDFGYEQAEAYSVVASRHHFRIWKAPTSWNGQLLWAGAGTHDIGFEKDQRNGKVTHKIDPAVDGERDNIGASLEKSGKVKSMYYYLPPNPIQDARNATGGGYHSDGRILVIVLQ